MDLEEIFLSVLNPDLVNNATNIIENMILNPDYIFEVLKLASITKHQTVFQLCSIQCWYSISKHWNTFSIDNKAKILHCVFGLLALPNSTKHFVLCVSFIIHKNPEFIPLVNNFIENMLKSNTMNISLIYLVISQYSIHLNHLDFSDLIADCFMNQPALVEYAKACIQLLVVIASSSHIGYQDNYQKCFYLFCKLPYHLYYHEFFNALSFFTFTKLIPQDEIQSFNELQVKELLNPSINTFTKLTILNYFTSNLNCFSDELIEELFYISFNIFTQIIVEENIFPTENIDIFSPFFELCLGNDEDCVMNNNILAKIYSFIKIKWSELSVCNDTSIKVSIHASILNVLFQFFDYNAYDIIKRDINDFIQILFLSLEANTEIIITAFCDLFCSLCHFYQFIETFLPQLIHKIVNIMVSPSISPELRRQLSQSFFCASENCDDKIDNLFQIIIQSESYFIQDDNLNYFIMCLNYAVMLDPTISDDQLIELYKKTRQIFLNPSSASIYGPSFSLLASIFSIIPSIDITFIFPYIHEILLTSKNSESLLVTSIVNFINKIVENAKYNITPDINAFFVNELKLIYTNNESSVIKYGILESTSLIAKYSQNSDLANELGIEILKNFQKDEITPSLIIHLLICLKNISKFLTNECAFQLCEYLQKLIFNQESEDIINQSIVLLAKLIKFKPDNDFLMQLGFDSANNFISKENLTSSIVFESVCNLISSIWLSKNVPDLIKINFFKYLMDQLLVSKNNVDEDYSYTYIIFGAFIDGIKFKSIPMDPCINILVQNIDHFFKIAITPYDQQNLISLLYYMINYESYNYNINNYILPYIEKLIQLFLLSLNNEQLYNIVINLAILLIEINNKIENSIPYEVLNQSLSLFPPQISSTTKFFLNSILKCFTHEKIFTNSSLMQQLFISLSKLFLMNKKQFAKTKVNENDIRNVQLFLKSILQHNNAILNFIQSSFSNKDFQMIIKSLQT